MACKREKNISQKSAENLEGNISWNQEKEEIMIIDNDVTEKSRKVGVD